MPLYFCTNSAAGSIDRLRLPPKGSHLIWEIDPGNGSLPTPVKSLKNLIELALITSSFID